MPHDHENLFQYDTLYESKKEKGDDSLSGGEYAPLGTGRKSQFAIGKKTQGESAPTEKTMPQSKKNASSSVSDKASVAGKKSASKKSAKKAEKKPPKTVKKTHSVQKAAVRKSESTKKSDVAKKTAAQKPDSVRNTSGKKAETHKKRTSPRKRHASAKKSSVREEFLSVAYLSGAAAAGIVKNAFGTRRGRIVTALVLGILLIVCGAWGMKSVYSSKTLFSDGGKDIDDTAIQERLITEEQNRDKVTYFLIVGVDKSQMLTDCIWVMCFDNKAHKMNVMQIPRDTYVGEDSNGVGKMNGVYKSPKTVTWCEKCGKEVFDDEIESDRHTVCGSQVTERTESNMDALIRVINNRLSLPVDHYVLFDFEGYEKVIDAMGGVDILLEEEMKVYPNKTDYIVLPSGLNHLDGETALKFMRNRKIYADGDIGRVKAQRRIIKAMLEKIDNMTTVEVFMTLKAAYGNFKTDMSLEEIRSFIAPIRKCGVDGLHMFEMPGNDYWVKGHPSYYVCDEQKTADVINEFMLPYRTKITAYNISFPELG